MEAFSYAVLAIGVWAAFVVVLAGVVLLTVSVAALTWRQVKRILR